MPQYWLLKTEPETYSFEQLLQDRKTNWNDVRNYQARNYLREVKKGDAALIYHSGDVKAVVGVAECVKEAYPDRDDEGGDWVQIDLKPAKPFKAPVPLSTIRTTETLKEMPLIRHTRLSVMPITQAHYETLCKLGGVK